MNCVSLLAITAGLGLANGDVARRLQVQQVGQRKLLNTWDDIEDVFIDIGDVMIDIGDVFVDGWEDIEEFFTEDMVEWFEEDFADFWVDFGEETEIVADEFADWAVDEFTDAWDVVVDGMESAWEWTETAAVTAWEYTENLFENFECLVQDWTGHSCIDCVEEACNETLDQETIDLIDMANDMAMKDMEGSLDVLFEGCASAMEKCPTLEDCKYLNDLPDSTKEFVKDSIAQCNLCYSCLPYGSTKETCQKALDQVMPNECEGCTENQQTLYKMWYSCSSLKAIHDGMTQLGEAYAEDGSGHESLDAVCEYCMNCSDYKVELKNTCSNWYYISDPENGWDYQPPEVPDVLVLEGTVVGVDHDTTDGSTSSGSVTPEPTAVPTLAPTESPTQPPSPQPTYDAASDDSSTGGRPGGIGGGRGQRATPSPTPMPTDGRPRQTSPPVPGGPSRPGRGGQTGRGRRGRL